MQLTLQTFQTWDNWGLQEYKFTFYFARFPVFLVIMEVWSIKEIKPIVNVKLNNFLSLHFTNGIPRY